MSNYLFIKPLSLEFHPNNALINKSLFIGTVVKITPPVAGASCSDVQGYAITSKELEECFRELK